MILKSCSELKQLCVVTAKHNKPRPTSLGGVTQQHFAALINLSRDELNREFLAMSKCLSVRPSVRHSLTLCQNGETCR